MDRITTSHQYDPDFRVSIICSGSRGTCAAGRDNGRYGRSVTGNTCKDNGTSGDRDTGSKQCCR